MSHKIIFISSPQSRPPTDEDLLIADFEPKANVKEFARVIAMISSFLLGIVFVAYFLGNLLIVP